MLFNKWFKLEPSEFEIALLKLSEDLESGKREIDWDAIEKLTSQEDLMTMEELVAEREKIEARLRRLNLCLFVIVSMTLVSVYCELMH